MERKLSVAIGATCSKPGDVSGNMEQIAAFARMAHGCGCSLLLTPEMSASGYGGYPEVLATAEPAGDGPIFEGLIALAARYRLTLLAGFAEKEADKRYLSHYIVFPDGRWLIQRKHRVTPRERPLHPCVALYYDETEEIGHVTPGDERLTYFTVEGIRCVVIICADFGLKNLHGILDENRVELILLPTGAGGDRSDKVTDAQLRTDEGLNQYRDYYDKALRFGDAVTDCIRHRRALAAVNQCGYDGRALYHSGSGSIVGPFGELAAVIPGICNTDRPQPRFACGEISFYESWETAHER